MRAGKTAAAISLVWALAACGHPDRPFDKLVDAKWSQAAMSAYASEPIEKRARSLPELRVYNRQHQLIFRIKDGFKPASVGADIDRAIAANKPIGGPSFRESLAELESRDGKALADGPEQADAVLFDYWAEWCVPCKVLGTALDAWAANKTNVRIVRAETDLMAASAKAGEQVIMMKKGSDGKITKTIKIMGADGTLTDPPVQDAAKTGSR